MSHFKVLSLFDGISCARVALKKAGYKNVEYYASEIDEKAIEVAMRNFPDTIQLGGGARGFEERQTIKKYRSLDRRVAMPRFEHRRKTQRFKRGAFGFILGIRAYIKRSEAQIFYIGERRVHA